MTLLQDIQAAAIDSSQPLGDLLRRCKLLAARLRSREFAEWVDHELGGHPSKDHLPDYRIHEVQSLGNFVGYGGSRGRSMPIPPSNIPKEYRHFATINHNTQPIGALENLVRSGDSAAFSAAWPADLVKIVSQDIYQHMSCVSAWQEIPRGMVIGILDAVRNRVLSFVLDIEGVAPNAGESLAAPSPLPAAQISTFFQTNIYGGTVGNVATGGEQVAQHVDALVTQGDFASLSGQLVGLGFSPDDITALRTALDADAKEGKPGIGRSIAGWIGKAIAKAGEGALKVGVEVAGKVLPTLINGYLGPPK